MALSNIPAIVGLLDKTEFPIIEALNTRLTLEVAIDTITSHLNSTPPSEGKTEISLLVVPTNLEGEIHEVVTEIAFFHFPGSHFNLLPGIGLFGIIVGSTVAIGAVRATESDCASISLIPFLTSVS